MKKLINFILSLFKKKVYHKKVYSKYYINEFDINLFNELNLYREKKGLPLLLLGSDKCFDIVGNHIDWLYNNITSMEDFKEKGHYYFNDRAIEIQKEVGSKNIGEVLAYKFKTTLSVVNAWDKSEKHSKILNDNRFTHVVPVSKGDCIIALFYN